MQVAQAASGSLLSLYPSSNCGAFSLLKLPALILIHCHLSRRRGAMEKVLNFALTCAIKLAARTIDELIFADISIATHLISSSLLFFSAANQGQTKILFQPAKPHHEDSKLRTQQTVRANNKLDAPKQEARAKFAWFAFDPSIHPS